MFCHVLSCVLRKIGSWGARTIRLLGSSYVFTSERMLHDVVWCCMMHADVHTLSIQNHFFQNIVVAVCECSACTAFQIRFDWSLGKWKHVEIKRQVIGIRMESETCPISCHWCGAYQRGDGYIWFPVGSQLPLGETNRHFVRPFHFGCHRCHRRVTMISLSFDVTISAWIQTWRLTTGDDDFAYWRATSATWLKHVETCRNMLKHVET